MFKLCLSYEGKVDLLLGKEGTYFITLTVKRKNVIISLDEKLFNKT